MKKVLFVSGASSDVGTTLIEHIADEYDKILCHYRNRPEKIDRLRSIFGDRIIALPAKSSSPERFIKQGWNPFADEINISLRSAVVLASELLPLMAKAGFGRVVFMLTAYTYNEPPQKFMAPYVAGKYALLGLMKSLAAEYAGKGVTINGVSPGMMDTSFWEGTKRLIIEQNAEKCPIKRNLTPTDLIGTFELLLSDSSSCVTGQNIAVTAGA